MAAGNEEREIYLRMKEEIEEAPASSTPSSLGEIIARKEEEASASSSSSSSSSRSASLKSETESSGSETEEDDDDDDDGSSSSSSEGVRELLKRLAHAF